MKIAVGSKSTRKIEAADSIAKELSGEEDVITTGYDVPSGVPKTPYGRQTYDGARNRALAARALSPDADLSVGHESGLVMRYGQQFEEAWCCVVNADGRAFFGYSSGLLVPDVVRDRMDDEPHAQVMSSIEEERGINHEVGSDTWATYTGSVISREVSIEEATRNALIQAIPPHDSLYSEA